MAAPIFGLRLRRLLRACGLVLAVAGGAVAQAAAPGEAAALGAVFHGFAHDTLYAVSFEGRTGIAVGDFGLVIESADGGANWQRQSRAPTDRALLTVVRKGGRCLAGGQEGLLFYADDCRDWHKATTPTAARIMAIDVGADGSAYAVGGFGTVLKSADAGKSWQALKVDWGKFAPEGAEPHLYAVHVEPSGSVVVAGEFELVLRSEDGGQSWKVVHQGKRSLFGLTAAANGDLYAVGQEGLILKEVQGRWTELPSGTRSILTSVWARADGKVVAAGVYTVLYSADGGASWRADTSALATRGWHQAIAATPSTNGVAEVVLVGSAGAVLRVER